MSSPVTMNDIAARAGVSQATVSFVLNNRREGINIPQTTRQRVLDAARDLGYRRNQLARAMVTGKSRILGIITVSQNNENIVRVLAGALEAANQNDYLIKILHLSYGNIDDSTIARCLEWRVAGAIVVGLDETTLEFLDKEFQRVGMAAAFVDNAPRRDKAVRVLANDEQGIRDVLSHLLELGHRRIAYIGGRPSFISRWREESFRAVLAEAGISVPDSWVRHSSWSNPAPMEREAMAILSGPERPSAIVCAADTIAMVVLRVARSLGIRLPDDLSVSGYSNATLSAFADPSLTTVDQSFHAMGHAAAEYLIQCAESSEGMESEIVTPDILLPTQLLVRASTAPCSVAGT